MNQMEYEAAEENDFLVKETVDQPVVSNGCNLDFLVVDCMKAEDQDQTIISATIVDPFDQPLVSKGYNLQFLEEES